MRDSAVALVGAVTNYTERDGHFSGKQAAALLSRTMQADDLLVCYGDYTATVPYYADHPMYALAAREEIAARAPKEMSWSSKNVMPFLPLDELPHDRTVYLVVERHAFDAFAETFDAQEWELLGQCRKRGGRSCVSTGVRRCREEAAAQFFFISVVE